MVTPAGSSSTAISGTSASTAWVSSATEAAAVWVESSRPRPAAPTPMAAASVSRQMPLAA